MVDPKVKQILDALLTHAEKVIDGIDCFYVALYNQVTVALDFPLAVKKSGEGLKRLETGNGRWVSRPYRPGEFLPDYIFADSQPVLIEEKFRDWIDKRDLKYYEGELPLSWLGVPLITRGRAIGAIVVESYEREHAYDTRTLALLSAMTNRVAGALANERLVRSLRAVNEVGQRMTSGIRLNTEGILKLIYQQASQLMDTRNMFIAVYDEGTDVVSFGLARQNGETVDVEKDEDWQPRKAGKGLTERVIRSRAPFCPQDVKAAYEEAGVVYVEPIPKSWLGVPMMIGDRVLGVIAVQNDDVRNLYGPDDQAVLQTMAGQAAVALSNARLVESLRAVNAVGQRLTSGIRLSTEETLELIYQQASRLMDTRNMYVALYDSMQQDLSFPLATYQGERDQWPSRKVDIGNEAKGGLTEEVIRTKRPFCPPNVEAWFEKRDLEPPVLPVPKSWLGVPMMVEDRVLGVIAVQNDDVKNLYGPDAQAVLQTMAGQAAVAIENARLYQAVIDLNQELQQKVEQLERAQEKIAEREAVLIRTSIAADFVHRLNNLAGTIPIWVDQIREHLGQQAVDDKALSNYLDNIESNTDGLLRAAEQLKSPPMEEDIDISSTLNSLVRQVRVQMPAKIKVELYCKETLPTVRAVSSELANALWTIMENGIDSMPDGGKLTVNAESTRYKDGKEQIEIQISDEGRGVAQEDAGKIFAPFYSTKPGHMGYGLWRARNIFERIGGSIDFESKAGIGTTFTIKVPVSREGAER